MSAYPSVVVIYKPTAMQVYTIPNLQPNHPPATDSQPCIAFVMLIHPIVEALTGFRGGGGMPVRILPSLTGHTLRSTPYPKVYNLTSGVHPTLHPLVEQ